MKKMFGLMLFVSIVLSFSSCEKDDLPNYYEKPMFVNEAPEQLAKNNSEAYIDEFDYQAAEYLGSRGIQSQHSYIDDNGNTVINHYYRQVVLYKIKARKYFGWASNIQYASDYKEDYQIEANQFAEIGEKLKNTGYVICYRCSTEDEENFFGLEKKICGIK